jgi:YD repeat-containing protein
MLVLLLSLVLCTSPAFVNAAENNNELGVNAEVIPNNIINSDNPIITINGSNYNAQEFMDRVLEYTQTSNPIDTMQTENGSKIKFDYNQKRQRTKKLSGKGTTSYIYDSFDNLKSEILPDSNSVEYSYTLMDGIETPKSITYQNNTYLYIYDANGIISGLLDKSNQVICEYVYDKNSSTKFIYKIKGEKKIKHKEDSGGYFIGCVNSLRYDGKYYDSETGMFCTNTGGYYDTTTNKIVGDDSHLDMKGLFGDQYDALSAVNNPENTISSFSISPGITSQCYNKGALSSTSSPNSKWRYVVFPGSSTDYTGASNYSAFTYFFHLKY